MGKIIVNVELALRYIGWFLILIGAVIFIEIIGFEIIGKGIASSYVSHSFWFIVSGFILLALERILIALNILIAEMKYMRNHKDKEGG